MQNISKNNHIKPLTSIRFFAAFFVFLCHLRYFYNTDISYVYIKEGFIGVTFFFILSGFILAYSYQNKIISGKTSIKSFYIARIARIYPIHVCTFIAAISLFSYGYYSSDQFIFNAALIQAFIPESKYYFTVNAVSWSISVELFLYLLLPFLIRLDNKGLLYLSIILVLLKLSMSISLSDKLNHAMVYISPFMRVSDFSIGILMYRYRNILIEKLSKLNILYLQAMSIITLVIFCSYSNQIPISYRYDLYYILPMSMIILSLSIDGTLIFRALSNRVFVFLGEVSFSFYMIHQMVIKFFVENNHNLNLTNWQLFLSMFLSSLLLSIIAYKIIEIPSKNIIIKLFREKN